MGWADREQEREYQRKYRAAHRDVAREYQREWRAKNADRRKAVDAAWREANRERIRAKHREWSRQNRDKTADNLARQRFRRKALMVEKVSRLEVWRRDKGICGICGEPADRRLYEIDHIVPLIKGGAHTFDNCQVAHPVCNKRKGSKSWKP